MFSAPAATMSVRLICLLACLLVARQGAAAAPTLSDERVVFQTEYGDIEFGFFPEVAPKTTEHIFNLVKAGLYVSNHFFRIDRGFVAQTSEVVGGRTAPMSPEQQELANKRVPLEVVPDVKHTTGVLSMARNNDPNSGGSSFSVLLGPAPHLDMQYAIFGNVTNGMETLRKLEGLETRREGIFVMPIKRITILSTYWYRKSHEHKLHLEGGAAVGGDSGGGSACNTELSSLKARYAAQSAELQRVRLKCLPGS